MNKWDCSKAIDYIHETLRMCNTIKTSPVGKCPNCPLANVGGCTPANGLTQANIDIIQKWSDEHPELPTVTKEERVFLETFKKPYSKTIRRTSVGLFLYFDMTNIELSETMFPFIEAGRSWSIEDLLKLEVEE